MYIAYINADGGVSIVIPAPECGLTIQEIAAKDVPQGVAHKIVDSVPEDRDARLAWFEALP